MRCREKRKRAVETWAVRDPIGESEEVYREVRDQIEQRVMRLILKARAREAAGRRRRSQELTLAAVLLDNRNVPPARGCGGIGRRARFRF